LFTGPSIKPKRLKLWWQSNKKESCMRY
jgi:hypothetical protein